MMLTLRWSAEQANQWYTQQPWLVGCNFTPSTAINQLEMWQADTFDPATIDRELGWGEAIGFNCVRVFLHDLLWQNDAEGIKQRISQYLDIAARHQIRAAFVFFDDCWNTEPKIGKQPGPRPGMHNSAWVQSPGSPKVLEPREWPCLEAYVKDIIRTFGGDARILFWDLYNEPGNNELGEKSLGLLQAVFTWARAVGPMQPLTVGVWFDNPAITQFQLEASDIITFHHYGDLAALQEYIQPFAALGRPLVCTEYMARTRGSLFATHLPFFAQKRIGCFNWGLVSGKTQTIYPWQSLEETPEPELWFHDIFRSDGRPFDSAEIKLIKRLTGREQTG